DRPAEWGDCGGNHRQNVKPVLSGADEWNLNDAFRNRSVSGLRFRATKRAHAHAHDGRAFAATCPISRVRGWAHTRSAVLSHGMHLCSTVPTHENRLPVNRGESHGATT